MDTIHLTSVSRQVRESVILGLQRHGIPAQLRDKDGRRLLHRYGYQKALAVLVNGHDAFAAYEPLPGFNNLPELFLSFHLSQFSTMAATLKWARPIFGDSFPEFPNMAVRRLDRCVDLAMPFETVYEAVQQLNVKRVMTYQGRGRRSLYLGRLPRQTVVYERWIEPELIDNEPCGEQIADSEGKILCVRIEDRKTGDKCPIGTLAEIEKLRGLNPFAELDFLELDEVMLANLSAKARHIIDSYALCKQRHGAQVARSEFSEGRNFHRNIGRHLKPFKLDMASYWQKRVTRFLGQAPFVFDAPAPSPSAIEEEEWQGLMASEPHLEAIHSEPLPPFHNDEDTFDPFMDEDDVDFLDEGWPPDFDNDSTN